MKQLLKKLTPLIIYIGLLILAAILCSNAKVLPYYFNNLILFFSLALLAIVITIAFIFNRSRVFFICLPILVSELLLLTSYNPLSTKNYVYAAIRAIIYIILPINILIATNEKEKGILSPGGRRQLFLNLVEFVFIGWIVISRKVGFINFLLSLPITIGGIKASPIIPFIIFNLAFIHFIYRIIKTGSSIARFSFVVLLSVYIGLFSNNIKINLPIFFSLVAILLLLNTLRDTYQLAYIDELTGLPGRRALRDKLAKLRGRYSIVMIDIDFFKKFNDTYGHDSGDEILRFIGKTLKEISGNGKGYRYGGEEFAVVFQGKGAKEVLPHIEELRLKIEKSKIPLHGGSKKKSSNRGKRVSITISSGIAEKCEKHPTANEVIKAADLALYRAKDKGRNCVCK